MKIDKLLCCLSLLVRFYVYLFFLSMASSFIGEGLLTFLLDGLLVTDTSQSNFDPIGDIWQCLQTLLVIIIGGRCHWNLGVDAKDPLNILQSTDQFQQRIIWLQKSLIINWRLRNHVLGQTVLVGAKRQPRASAYFPRSLLCLVLALEISLLSGKFIHKLQSFSKLFE